MTGRDHDAEFFDWYGPEVDTSQVAVGGMSVERQVDYWQERYFALLDEHAACLNQLQAIRRLLDNREWQPDANYSDPPEGTP
jgi:hypothetical protein